jgi:small subunit ribosomal protein S16
MAVRLRLMRMGKRNRPCYRICVVDRRKRRDGAYIESIGFYDPFIRDRQKSVHLDKERAEYWIGVGAEPTETVGSFLRDAHVQGLYTPKKSSKRPAKKKRKLTGDAKARAERIAAKKSARREVKAKKIAASHAQATTAKEGESPA